MAAPGYYDRAVHQHLDGTPIFASQEDTAAESDVAAIVSRAWGCELHRFGTLSPIDWYATRAGRMVGVVELKHRSHDSAKYPTVFLNVRKWLALSLAQAGLGVPALFVVQFLDGIRWIRTADIDASRIKIGGCKGIVKAISDVEPVIEVPSDELQIIKV